MDYALHIGRLALAYGLVWLHKPLIVAALAGVAAAFLLVGLVVVPILARISQKMLEKSQNQFTSLCSHYLLTPISIIQAAISRLQEAEALSAEDQRKIYGALERGERRLWITAQQLLTINQLNTTGIKTKFEPADFAEVVSNSITIVDSFAQEHQVKIVFKNFCESSAQQRIDAKYLTQALVAVLDNAIKFSPQGMTVVVGLQGDHTKGYEIIVQDAGSGIAADMLHHIGERFTRGTSLDTFDQEGMGIGLYIAKTLVETLGGQFKVETKAKTGTIIRFFFPA